MKTTSYFEEVVRLNHPEVQPEWIERVLANPVKTKIQLRRTSMKIHYFPNTDTLYINLSEIAPANTDAITDNLIVDFDVLEQVVGITIEQASKVADLAAIETINLPETIANR